MAAEERDRHRERRVAARIGVDTRAVLYLVDLAARMDGRILDLSLLGCCIRTDQRFPLGIFRRVEMEFRLDGLPIRLGGVTQAIHDPHRVGIRFLDLSPRKREQLSELIEEIEEVLRKEQAASGAQAPPCRGAQT